MDEATKKSLLYAKMAIVLILLVQIFMAYAFHQVFSSIAMLFTDMYLYCLVPAACETTCSMSCVPPPPGVLWALVFTGGYWQIVHIAPVIISGILVLLFFVKHKKPDYDYASAVFFITLSAVVQLFMGGLCLVLLSGGLWF